MPQAFGWLNADGSVGGGSGNFTATKAATGQYQIVVDIGDLDPGLFQQNAAMCQSPESNYVTAVAMSAGQDGATFYINTGFTDQGSTNYMDVPFSFIIMWP